MDQNSGSFKNVQTSGLNFRSLGAGDSPSRENYSDLQFKKPKKPEKEANSKTGNQKTSYLDLEKKEETWSVNEAKTSTIYQTPLSKITLNSHKAQAFGLFDHNKDESRDFTPNFPEGTPIFAPKPYS